MTAQPALSAILLIACPDKTGIVAAVTDFIFRYHGNILSLDQHVDAEEDMFLMRVTWDIARFAFAREAIAEAFRPIATAFDMTFSLHFSDEVPRMAVFVSKYAHCLHDILARWQIGEWRVEIPLIISNHPDLAPVAERAGIPYHHFDVNAMGRAEAEAAQRALLRQHAVDFIVLARYMLIVSPAFIAEYPNRIINIHHSFLPAFIGAKPYHAAYGRGVKIIGATSHYVTADLDAGPIIAQDVTHIDHKDTVDAMIRKGRDTEKLVLARAVWHHLQRHILVYRNRTVIFG
jgi:formyltetrahydrofolate deformylase